MKERDARIFDMWMACYAQEEIAETVGCGQSTISEVLSEQYLNTESIEPVAEHMTDFDPPIYNIWKQQTKSNGVSHYQTVFGAIPYPYPIATVSIPDTNLGSARHHARYCLGGGGGGYLFSREFH
jgi:hypothetical protein